MELTSLLDVMFLVLVFFIYSIFNMTVHRGLHVDLPSAGGDQQPAERIDLTILADDSLQFNGRPATREEILSRIAELKAVKADLPVLIAGDRASSLGTGLELLAALRAAGVGQVSFQVTGDD